MDQEDSGVSRREQDDGALRLEAIFCEAQRRGLAPQNATHESGTAACEAARCETRITFDLTEASDAADQIARLVLASVPAELLTNERIERFLASLHGGGLEITIPDGGAAAAAGDQVIRLRVAGVGEACAAALGAFGPDGAADVAKAATRVEMADFDEALEAECARPRATTSAASISTDRKSHQPLRAMGRAVGWLAGRLAFFRRAG